jgi:hypothetical protein
MIVKPNGNKSDREQTPEFRDALPYRRFRDWPTSIFIEEVVTHLKATGQPETMEALNRNKIPKDVKFRILQKIAIDPKKRPDGDLAPCPMCTPNKFISGALVFLPELECCAVIGHCCASKKARDEADREHRWRTKRDFEESTLLAGLPLLPKKAAVLKSLRPAAEEARRVFRRFRREVPSIHKHLRTLKDRRGGPLMLSEIVEDESREFGPRGLERPSGDEKTREIEFGVLVGLTAVTKDYNPVSELNYVISILESLEARPGEEAAIDFIISMTEAQRRAAVAILQVVDKGHAKFIAKLTDFALFFTRENIERLQAYGTHPANHFAIEAKFETIHGRPRISMRHRGERCQLLIPAQVDDINFPWP